MYIHIWRYVRIDKNILYYYDRYRTTALKFGLCQRTSANNSEALPEGRGHTRPGLLAFLIVCLGQLHGPVFAYDIHGISYIGGYVHIYLQTCTYVFVYTCIYVCLHMYICIYVHICAYICTHVHTCTDTDTYPSCMCANAYIHTVSPQNTRTSRVHTGFGGFSFAVRCVDRQEFHIGKTWPQNGVLTTNTSFIAFKGTFMITFVLSRTQILL